MTSDILPRLAADASIARYRCYLDYLDRLAALHAAERATAPFDVLRRLIRGRRAS